LITKQDLLEAIAECQGTRTPNANTAIKLAAFYTILDHLDEEKEPPEKQSFSGYSFASNAVNIDSESEFAQAIRGKPQSEVWPVIDELMATIKLMNERLYNGVLRKL
jgi:hypothetical protein